MLGDFPQHFLPPLSNVQQSFIDLCLMFDQEWVYHHPVQLLGALHNHTHTHTFDTARGLGAATCTYIILVEDGSLILAWESWLPTKDIH